MDKKIEKEGSFSALKHILSLANVCFLICSFSGLCCPLCEGFVDRAYV